MISQLRVGVVLIRLLSVYSSRNLLLLSVHEKKNMPMIFSSNRVII